MTAKRIAENIYNKITDDKFAIFLLASTVTGGILGTREVINERKKYKEHIGEFIAKFTFYGIMGAWMGCSVGILAPVTIPLGIVGATIYKVTEEIEIIEE